MPRTILPALWLALLAALPATRAAHASPPNAYASYVSPHLVTCPAGDSALVVIVRDTAGNPWLYDCCTELNLCGCPGYRVSRTGTHPYTVDSTGCIVSAALEVPGANSAYPLAGGGLCPGDSVSVWAGGVLLRVVTQVASLDQDGNLAVDGRDVALVQAKVGTSDPTADFDGDGRVTPADVAIVTAHLGHRAPDAVDAVPAPSAGPLALSTAWPNPFAGETHFGLTLDRVARVSIVVCDVSGRSVMRVFDGEPGPGTHAYSWAGRTDDGRRAPAGLYFVCANVAGRSMVRTAVFVGGR